MSAKFRTLTIAAVVIIAVVGFFALRDNYPPKGDEVTGAIGTVEKHQESQITPSDVVLEGYDVAEQQAIIEEWLGEDATIDEVANLMGRASAQERARFYKSADFKMARAMFERQSIDNQRAILQRVDKSLDRTTFAERSVAEQEKVLARVTPEDAAAMVRDATQAERRSLARAIPAQERYSLFERASVAEKRTVLSRSTPDFQRVLFERQSLERQWAQMQRTLSAQEKSMVLSRLDPQGKMFLFAKMPAQERVNAFVELGKQDRNVYARMNVDNEKSFRGMDQGRQIAAMERCGVEIQAAAFDRTSLERQIAAMERVNAQMGARDIQMQRQILARTTPQERVSMYRALPDNERVIAFDRAFRGVQQ
jgi:Mg/Co/Ni transporter MgtE